MKFDGRKALRVKMDHKQAVNLMGSDGTWRRSCVLLDISQSGAKIEVEGTLDVLQAKEFFMLLSSTGLAYRRCELVRVNGTEMGIQFLKGRHRNNKKSGSRNEAR